MKKENFKNITKKHISHCEGLIVLDGKCKYFSCKKCPFNAKNLTKKK